MIYPIEISEPMRRWADDKASVHIKGFRYDKELDTTGQGVLAGYQGDSIFMVRFPDAIHADQSAYDFILRNHKIEVKTQWTGYETRRDWFVQLAEIDAKRAKDIYFFCSIMRDRNLGYLLGWEFVADFNKRAIHRRKGDVRTHPTYHKYNADCYEVTVGSLRDVNDLDLIPAEQLALFA